jgi:hypothetical protein
MNAAELQIKIRRIDVYPCQTRKGQFLDGKNNDRNMKKWERRAEAGIAVITDNS